MALLALSSVANRHTKTARRFISFNDLRLSETENSLNNNLGRLGNASLTSDESDEDIVLMVNGNSSNDK